MAKCTACGKGGLTRKLNGDGICLECASTRILELTSDVKKLQDEKTDVKKQLDQLQQSISPEMQTAIDLQQEIERRETMLASANAQLSKMQEDIEQAHAKLNTVNKSLLVAEDAVEMETFSLYIPKFDFAHSEEYKNKLNQIRDLQKDMLRAHIAAKCEIEWTVDGSKSKGKKMTNDTIKLLLRSFNNECDIAVSSVRFSNFDRCEDRIYKAFITLNHLGESNRIAISRAYYDLKIKELHLAYEYQQKKEEEREALRALKEQQREEAKLLKEIEAARKEAEKEKKHYLQALEKIHAQIAACQSDVDRADLLAKQNELVDHMDDIAAKLEDMDYRQANQKAGYVYVISNIGSFGKDVYKIGMTRRLDPMERVYELGDASVPFRFDVHAMIFSDDAPRLEAALHRAFADRRVNGVNFRREYFRVSLDEIKSVVLANHDKTVEFTETPEAQQYRETLLMNANVKTA